MWLNGHRRWPLAQHDASNQRSSLRSCPGLIRQLHVPLMRIRDIKNICNAVSTEWKVVRNRQTYRICKPLWACRIFCPDGLVYHIAGTPHVVSLKDLPIKFTTTAASRSLCLLTTLLCAPMGRFPTDRKGAPHDMLAEERRLQPSICTSMTGAVGATDHMLVATDLDPAVTCDAALVPRLRDMSLVSRPQQTTRHPTRGRRHALVREPREHNEKTATECRLRKFEECGIVACTSKRSFTTIETVLLPRMTCINQKRLQAGHTWTQVSHGRLAYVRGNSRKCHGGTVARTRQSLLCTP